MRALTRHVGAVGAQMLSAAVDAEQLTVDWRCFGVERRLRRRLLRFPQRFTIHLHVQHEFTSGDFFSIINGTTI
jgi:hypothetical protein